MREIKNVLLCGLGAIGSIFADSIIKSEFGDFRVLLDENRLKSYLENPVKFNGRELCPDYILPSDNHFKADLIIISTKYFGLNDAIKNIKNFVSSDTVILSLLNGITSEKLIAEKYGFDKILYSYFIGHSSVRQGRNITQDGVYKIVFGSDKNLENVDRVKDYFDKVGINYEIPDDITYSMWLKFMLNVSSNQVSAILRYNFGQMFNNEKCMEFIVDVMKEVQAVAKAEGVRNTDRMLDDAMTNLKTMSPVGRTSMLQDVEAHRKTEVDMFAGTILEFGKKHNIPTPCNSMLMSLINSIQGQSFSNFNL